MKKTDAITKRLTKAWSRNVSDERAIEQGCTFDEERALFVVWWIERHCKLYEGEQAGQPMLLHSCHTCARPIAPQPATFAEALPELRKRAARHGKCVAAGHQVDWQFECVMRLFGWVRFSARWQREVRRFTRARIWVSKKNKKTPTSAAIGLYLLIGDGERGQKVFLCAKDATQVRQNLALHAMEMVASSHALNSVCKRNQSSYEITHLRSKSRMIPLSSANAQTEKSKEGINGSAIIDEGHVVDREFIGRISRAGISRSEPLELMVSTAGDDPEGWGFEQFEHSQAVIDGTATDESFFAAIYAAPQNLSDEELAADPLKYGRLANPAMGHTVDPEEFLRDYHNSKATSLAEFARFKKYRLNIWQAGAVLWIRSDLWSACQRDYSLETLRGRPCWAGLDLSITSDLSACVFVFPADELDTYRLWPLFWLPEEEARRLSDQVSFLDWAAKGHIRLIAGRTIQKSFVKTDIVQAVRSFDLRLVEIRYDKYYAEDLTGELEDELQVTRVEFGQTMPNFAGPTAEFERLILNGSLWHPGNPLLTWQAGHVYVKHDAAGNRRPVKPGPNSIKKIDGIVAAIMGLSGAVIRSNLGGSVSAYDSKELLIL